MGNPYTTEIVFRTMHPPDIEAGLRLCRSARWNQTSRDWEMFLKLNPAGCRVAVKDETVIGTVTTVRYEDRFSWIGMVLVDPAERGQGIGTRLISEALDVLKDMPSIKLDATPAGCEVYRKLNFVDEYRLSRMEKAAPCDGLMQPGNPARPMTKGDLPAIAIFDRQVFGAERRMILEWMFDGAPEYAWVIEQEGQEGQEGRGEQGGQVAGYTFGRHGFNFEHLGPVVAHDQQTARRLVEACVRRQADRKFILDASHYEPDWRVWLESIGFREQRPFIRMFYRDNPHPGLPPKQFGILGPEFG
jgi:GNAT superfamily N-acetyltransferase